MEIFTGFLPEWLEEEDVKIFDRARRRAIIINEGDTEGIRGFSGRDSLEIFNNFYNRYKNRDELIDMGNLLEFFNEDRYNEKVPEDFLGALERNYDYNLLQQIEESMFFYNKEQIAKDILDYLFAVNLDTGSTVECPYTGRKLNITERYYLNIERKLIKGKPDEKQCRKFRDGILKLYVSRTLQEINSGKDFEQTEQFRDLLKRYYQNLKENVLKPFVSNENFRRAIKDFGGKGFKNYDNKIREEVKFLIKNLTSGFGYTEKGAKQICMYVIDRKIVEKFAE
jgi:hypothetical protein